MQIFPIPAKLLLLLRLSHAKRGELCNLLQKSILYTNLD